MPRSKHILYLQSNKETSLLTKTMLDERGYQTVIAESVAEANELATASRFNLYLLESILPDKAEFDLCREIRRLDSANPVLFYSQFAFRRDVDAAVDAGATGYCISPPEFLVERILHLTAASSGQSKLSANAS